MTVKTFADLGGSPVTTVPEEILDLWLEYVNSLDVEKVVSLYDDESLLLPTFSPHTISGCREREDYFRKLSTGRGLSVRMHRETVRKSRIDEHTYIVTGVYSFYLETDDAQETFPARFTFVLDVSRERPIIHHHSSQMPGT